MARKLDDIISDVDRLYGQKWGISVEEAHVLTSEINSLRARIRGLQNCKFNNDGEIEKQQALLKDILPILKQVLKSVEGQSSQFALEVSVGFLVERIEEIFHNEII